MLTSPFRRKQDEGELIASSAKLSFTVPETTLLSNFRLFGSERFANLTYLASKSFGFIFSCDLEHFMSRGPMMVWALKHANVRLAALSSHIVTSFWAGSPDGNESANQSVVVTF